MGRKIAIVGGDLRNAMLSKILLNSKELVLVYGLEKYNEYINKNNICKCLSVEDAVNNCEFVIGPLPLKNEEAENELIEHAISVMNNNQVFVTGKINNKFKECLNKKNIKWFDILEREEFVILNAIATAEGAVQIAIENTLKTIHNSNVLVLGFGRIGKVLCKMLNDMGAVVSCEARKNSDLAFINAYGYNPINIKKLEENIKCYDIIINTVPSLILNKKMLDLVNKEALLIDLASKPGGIDFEYAGEIGVKAIWALALPGKVAPYTSAEYIKETFYNIIEENKL